MDQRKATHRCKGCSAMWALCPPSYPKHCGANGCAWCKESSWTCVKAGKGYGEGTGPICGPCCDVAAMTDQIEPLGFHGNSGLFFIRLYDGGVAVEKRTNDHASRLESRVVFTAEAWASIVSSMSAAGETYDTWKAALDKQRG